MPSWQGQSKGTPLGYRIFVWVLRKFGVSPAYLLLRFVALYYFLFSIRSSKAIYHFLRERLGYGRLRALSGVYRNYYIFGQTIIDRVVLMAGIPNKFSFHFDGEHNLHEIVAQKRGGLLLSAHVGSWDIAGNLLKKLNTKVHIIMFDGEHEKIKQYIKGVTGERSVNVIIIRDDLSHIYEISAAFSRNELVCMHADRFLEGNKILSTQFLGAPANFPVGPFILARTFKVPVSFVFAMKETDTHYHLFSSPIKEIQAVNTREGHQQMLYAFAAEVENKVRRYPLHWFNYYNFWQQ